MPIHPVMIAGAGPGDPDLLTVKALRSLEQAEAVVYDRLIPESILKLIPRGAARFFAGKSCKQHVMTQEEINDLLVASARAGRRVVRLKGGDPFIFGRGGEEAEHLARHGIPFEIIPGVTSASGCSAAAGIPLTHRGLASGVRYITGHCKDPATEMDFASLADPDTTLVVYMGLADLGIIARELIAHGLSADFPAAAIQDATLPTQRVVTGTLATLHEKVLAAKLEPPTLLIIGRVVTLYASLRASALGTRSQGHDCLPVLRISSPSGRGLR